MANLRLFLLKIRYWGRNGRWNPTQKSGHHVAQQDDEGLGISHFKGEKEVECTICLCKIENGDLIRDLICEHLFHKACLDRWIGDGRRRRKCPLCRGSIEPKRIGSKLKEKVQELEEQTIFCFSPFSSSMDLGRSAVWLNQHHW